MKKRRWKLRTVVDKRCGAQPLAELNHSIWHIIFGSVDMAGSRQKGPQWGDSSYFFYQNVLWLHLLVPPRIFVASCIYFINSWFLSKVFYRYCLLQSTTTHGSPSPSLSLSYFVLSFKLRGVQTPSWFPFLLLNSRIYYSYNYSIYLYLFHYFIYI